MNKIIKIFILYCLPILTIQSCGKQCRSKPVSDSDTNSNNQNSVSNAETNSNSQNVSQNQQPISSITEAMCKKTKDYLGSDASTALFFEQTIQEIRNGNPPAVNKQNAGDYNRTLLSYAINSDNEELFEELLKLSPDLAKKDAHGSTILMITIQARKVKLVDMILARPKVETFIDEPDSQNRTPLDCAEYYEFLYANIHNDPQKKSDFADIIKALQAKKAKRAV